MHHKRKVVLDILNHPVLDFKEIPGLGDIIIGTKILPVY